MKFVVNNSDRAYPKIVAVPDDFPEGKTIGKCRQEILDRARAQMNHARDMAHYAKTVKVADILVHGGC